MYLLCTVRSLFIERYSRLALGARKLEYAERKARSLCFKMINN